MNLEINQEESVIVHNAVIFMANDLMQEIVDLEAWLAEDMDYDNKNYKAELDEKRRRWQVMVDLTNKVKG